MTLYCESSAIVSVYLRELGRHEVVQQEIEREPAVCSLLSYVEVHAALARARFKDNPRRLTATGYQRSKGLFETDWPNYARIPVTEELIRQAGSLSQARLLRAYYAMHLATALALREQVPDEILVSTWDRELAEAAEAEGLSLAHEVSV